MRWDEFERACPRIARLAGERFATDQLVMMGTLRSDGWPRISPCEVDVAGGHLLLGMMWRSRKAQDLLRDARVVVHTVTSKLDGTDGDVKLYGRAAEVSDPVLRTQFRQAIQARTGWAPEEPSYHLFSVDVERAGYVVNDEGTQRAMSWDAARGFREWEKPG